MHLYGKNTLKTLLSLTTNPPKENFSSSAGKAMGHLSHGPNMCLYQDKKLDFKVYRNMYLKKGMNK